MAKRKKEDFDIEEIEKDVLIKSKKSEVKSFADWKTLKENTEIKISLRGFVVQTMPKYYPYPGLMVRCRSGLKIFYPDVENVEIEIIPKE